MGRKLVFTAVVLALSSGVAAAERGPRVSDHRGGVRVDRGHSRPSLGYDRGSIRVRADGQFHFPGGGVRRYRRPAVTTVHRDYYQRPASFTESYQSMAGYTWVPGSWQWNGYQWTWVDGYYTPATSYSQGYGQGYAAPTYSSPTYSSPTYSSPTYSSPTYSYTAPSYPPQSYSSPTAYPHDSSSCTHPNEAH